MSELPKSRQRPPSATAPLDGPTEPDAVPQSRKRRTPRVAVRRRVESATSIGRVFGFTRDIGGGGLFLRTADLLPEGTELDLQVQLQPDSEPVTVHGRVIRAIADGTERGMAIAFAPQGQSSERQFIQSFVREVELQIKLEQLDQAKRTFLTEVRAFQEEKLAFERQRLVFADQEITQAQQAQALRDESRQLKRALQEKGDALDARQRRKEAELDREREQLAIARREVTEERALLATAHTELETDRQKLLDETDQKREALAVERQQLLADLERERKLHKALATRKTAEKEKVFDAHVVELQQQLGSLGHINELLESRCRDLEHRTEAIRSDEAGRIAQIRAQLAEQEARAHEQSTKQQRARAHLETTVAQLRQQLLNRDRDLGQVREAEISNSRHLQERLQEEQAQAERLNAELDGQDGFRAQLVTDLNASREEVAELQARLTALTLERDEATAHAEFRDGMMTELQERIDESLGELEAEKAALEAERAALEAERAALEAERQHLLAAAAMPQSPTYQGAPTPAAAAYPPATSGLPEPPDMDPWPDPFDTGEHHNR